MSVKGEIKQGAGFIKEEMNENGSLRKASERPKMAGIYEMKAVWRMARLRRPPSPARGTRKSNRTDKRQKAVPASAGRPLVARPRVLWGPSRPFFERPWEYDQILLDASCSDRPRLGTAGPVQVFGDSIARGAPCSGGRRPKSAEAGSRGKFGTVRAASAMGFDSRAGCGGREAGAG